MLSILIPIYNYNVFPLVLELHKQCVDCGIPFEILGQDDVSNQFLDENLKIISVENCRFSINNSNLGRGKNINLLAEKSKYDYLLIMDCDTLPTQNNFIQKYIEQINQLEKLVFGGISYQKEKPDHKQLLRWVYGKARESLSVEKRNANPNGSALTSNLLIQKNIFFSSPFDKFITKYGYEDLVFLSDLKKKEIIVKHIDNPTYHLGLETSQQFLDKTKIALENLKLIANSTAIIKSASKILKSYEFLKKVHLIGFISFLFTIGKRKIEENLLSQTPSLFLFDLYKLGYFCKLNTI